MKKLLLLSLLIGAVASAAFAQTGSTTDVFTFTPSTQTVSSNSSFTIQVGVTGSGVTPANLAGWDLWLVTNAANSGLFSITNVTYASGFTFTGAPPTVPDPINQPAATGFVRNSGDIGGVGTGTAPTPPFANTLLETLTISTGTLAPATTYTFFSSTATNAGTFYSDLVDSNGDTWTTAQSQFSINTAVPEPATWSLIALGGLGAFGLNLLRARRKS
jgi:hypothetical protein